jgi:prolyl-tRNA synthetase
MKQSQLFTKTSKDTPTGESSKNAQLLIRAGYIDKTMAGVYAMQPLGIRVLNKLENIVREEMNDIGSQELLMNALQPKKLWTDTKRWENVDILFKLKSQTDNDYALACSHEEQVTPLVKKMVTSFKDLPRTEAGTKTYPLSVYQIQTKFRDELRAKSGLLRGREFRMKDMYDFHQDQESLDTYYELVKDAYAKAYKRMGLEVYATEASGGIFTTNPSHEFQAICEAGEDKIYKVPSTGVFYNEEMAPVKAKTFDNTDEEILPRKDVEAEGVIGVEALCKFFDIPVEKSTKTIFYEDQNGNMLAACVRSSYKINEEKLMKVSGRHLKIASEETVRKVTGASIGYAGLIDLPSDVEVFVDESLRNTRNFEMGTNKDGYHSINVNFGRDIPTPTEFYDIKIIQEGDLYPETGEKYEVYVSAEVGNIFKLGTKYSDAIDFKFVDDNNQLKPVIMGCHGIGTTRCMAVVAETYNDENGLKWPKSIAPFVYHVIPHINPKDDPEIQEKISRLAQYFYEKLGSGELFLCKNQRKFKLRGEVCDNHKESSPVHGKICDPYIHDKALLDDRFSESLGSKLKDADLLGMPYQVIITKRSLENGGVEVKDRMTGESFVVELPEV